MNIDYNQYVTRMIVEIADRQPRDQIKAVNLQLLHQQRFSECPATWNHNLATELCRRGLGIDWQDSANESFRPTGALFSEAARIRELEKVQEGSIHVFPVPPMFLSWQFWRRPINWTKWGTILSGVGILVAIFLAVAI